jgi:hypothetical protein
MQTLQKLVQKYDAATVFVFAATIVVIIELSLMRILVPSPASGEELTGQALMEQVCASDNLTKTSRQVEGWEQQTLQISQRLSSSPDQWQKELVTTHAFGQSEIENIEFSPSTNRNQYLAAADYAADNLSLQSVMTGRTTLANINGRIYRSGDTISLRGGEIVLSIMELGTTYAVVQLAEHDVNGDTKRTIYLANNAPLVNGER